MGTHITFALRPDPDDMCGSLLFEQGDFEEVLGTAYFSAFTERHQRLAYGIDYLDCLTYGPEGDEEMLGHPDSDSIEGWFTPDWERALVRAEQLLEKSLVTENAHRREYDASRLPVFIELIRKCAAHPNPKSCQVSLSM
jgi:hypothetical protein